MSRRWFRMYEEVLDDPKVQKLDCVDFKLWINLLCLASRNDGLLPSIADVGFALRFEEGEARALLERLLSGGLLDKLSGGVDGYRYAPHGWKKRQYKSDISTERVKRFRECQRTVSETAPEQRQRQRQSQSQSNPPTPQGGQEEDVGQKPGSDEPLTGPERDELRRRIAGVADHEPIEEGRVAKILGETMRRARMTAPPIDSVLIEKWLHQGIDEQLIFDTVTRLAATARTPIRALRYFDGEILRVHHAKASSEDAEIAEFKRIAARSGG